MDFKKSYPLLSFRNQGASLELDLMCTIDTGDTVCYEYS